MPDVTLDSMDGAARRGLRVVLCAAVLLAACGDGRPTTPAVTTLTTVTTAVAPISTVPARTSTTRAAAVPNVVGRDLGTARALLDAAGYRFNPHDATQKGRTPADDWVVYSQSPGPGTPPVPLPGNIVIYLEVLRKGERRIPPDTSPCPRFAQC